MANDFANLLQATHDLGGMITAQLRGLWKRSCGLFDMISATLCKASDLEKKMMTRRINISRIAYLDRTGYSSATASWPDGVQMTEERMFSRH